MAPPTDRDEFKALILRRLGDGAITVNVTDDQVEDAIDYSLSRFRDMHFDGSFRTYVPHEITSNNISDGYLTVANNVLEVTEVFPLSSTLMGVGMWNLQYQFLLTSLDLFRSVDLSNWVIVNQNLQMMQGILVGQQPVRFNR